MGEKPARQATTPPLGLAEPHSDTSFYYDKLFDTKANLLLEVQIKRLGRNSVNDNLNVGLVPKIVAELVAEQKSS